ncbi:MAG: hypothetical protein ACKODM_09275 [Cytophagales bacterium]
MPFRSQRNSPSITILIEPREKFEDKYLDVFFFPLPSINHFPFRTDLDIQKARSSIVIISGTKSAIHKDALALKKLLKFSDHYFEINGGTHQSILQDKKFDRLINDLLNPQPN